MNKFESINQEEVKNLICSLTDSISEFDMQMDNINILTEEIFISLTNQIDLTTQRGIHMAQYDLKVLQAKSSMVRDFVVRACTILKKSINLTDKYIAVNNYHQKE